MNTQEAFVKNFSRLMNYLLPLGARNTVWGKQQISKRIERKISSKFFRNKNFVKLSLISGALEGHTHAQSRVYAQKRHEKAPIFHFYLTFRHYISRK